MKAIFADPVNGGIHWSDIEALLIHHGAERQERSGSRVLFILNGSRALFHRPHPRKEAGAPMVRSVRRFLIEAGVKP